MRLNMKGAVLPVLCFPLVGVVVAGLVFVWWWNHSGSLFPLQEFVTNQAGTFESGPELPTPRTESGSTVDDGRFYVAGGIDAWDRTLTSFLQYDPVSKRWQALSDLPEPINHPAIVSANGRIYTVGGFGPLGIRLRGFMFAEWHPLDSVYVFDSRQAPGAGAQ